MFRVVAKQLVIPAKAGIQDVDALNSGCRIKSGMTDDLITVENQPVLINLSGTSRCAGEDCSVTT